MDVDIRFRATQRVACMSHVGPYGEVTPLFEKMAAYAAEHGLFGPATRAVGIYCDDPNQVAAEKLRSHVGFVVMPGVEGDEEAGVEVLELAPGDYAIARHVGSYAGLGDAYGWLQNEWLPSSGREFADLPVYEFYVSDPANTPEDELLTLIHLPLKPAS